MTTLPNDKASSTTGTERSVPKSTSTTTGPSLVPLAPRTITLPNDDDNASTACTAPTSTEATTRTLTTTGTPVTEKTTETPVTAATKATTSTLTTIEAPVPPIAAAAAAPGTSATITTAGVTSTLKAKAKTKLKSYHNKYNTDDDDFVAQSRLIKTELSEFQSVVAVVAYDILETESTNIKTKPLNQKMDMIFDVCHGIIGTDDDDPNKRPSQFDLLVEGKDKRYKKLWREEQIYDDHDSYDIQTDFDSSSNNNNQNNNNNNNSSSKRTGTGTIRVIKPLYNCRSISIRRRNIRLIAGVDVTTDFLRRSSLNKNQPIRGRTLMEIVTATIRSTKKALSYAYQFLDQETTPLQERTNNVNNLINYILDKMWIDENLVGVNVHDDSRSGTVNDIKQVPPRPKNWRFKGYMAFCLFACPIITNSNDRLGMFFDTTTATTTATATSNTNTSNNNTSSHEESLQAESNDDDDNGDGDGDGDGEQQKLPQPSSTTKSVRHRQQQQKNTTSIGNNRATPEPPEQQQQQRAVVVASSYSNVDGLMKIYETRFQGILNERTQVMELVKFYHHDMKDIVGTKRQLDVLNELETEMQQLKKKMKSAITVAVANVTDTTTTTAAAAASMSNGGYRKRRTQPLPTTTTTQEGTGGNSSSQSYIV
jgi:hypothetical protein